MSARQDNRNNLNILEISPTSTSCNTTPLFTKTIDPLEANHWLRVNESKFRLLNYFEFQKTLFAGQQFRGSASAWWPRILPLFRTITKCRGMSSVKHSAGTTFQ
jgi:hypothetical protein